LRVLILGAAGMLGHKLAQQFRDRFDVWATLRGGAGDFARYGLIDSSRLFPHVDASSFDAIVGAVTAVRPEAVINCIGVIKQLPTATDPIVSIETNSLLPHRLAALCRESGARLVHISTDCVFSGSRGHYTEDDPSDAEDLYGRSKFLGEVGGEAALTLRTSIIGRELRSTSGLVEWSLSQRGRKISGWRRAIYTGLTTLVLSRVIGDVLENHRDLSGVHQVASEPIDKYSLLCLVRDAFRLDVEIEPSDEVRIDRSLNGSRFHSITGFTAPSWNDMIAEMAGDPTPYDQWRHS
jgi:dTDP-4-dehydrorhamnose reductase